MTARAGFPVMVLALALLGSQATAAWSADLTVDGTRFRRDGVPFPYTGVSFFNALYNEEFNRSSEARGLWLDTFRKHGINVLRVWAQWDNPRGYVDACPDCSLYRRDGTLREAPLSTLRALLADADARGMVVQLTLFSQESWRAGIRLDEAAAESAVRTLAQVLQPHRNLVFQVWNEHSWHTIPLVKIIKSVDARRLVTSSPGVAGVLTGPPGEADVLDYLTPHTSRQNAGRPWEIAPKEIAYLIARYGKPVVDDEPARNGTSDFGGPKEATDPIDHVLQIWGVRQMGGYSTYHHDMFQTGKGHPSVPPSGVPDPEFSPYHRVVFAFLAKQDRYAPATREQEFRR